MSSYGYFVTESARRDLRSISSVDQKRIGRKLQYFLTTDDPFVFAVQLVGIKPTIYRFRIGKYRVFADVKDNIIRILNVSLRDKAYRNIPR